MCAVDSRPATSAHGTGFKLFAGGLLPRYCAFVIHPTTFNKILGKLNEEVEEDITSQLARQYKSGRALGWTGPFVSVQMDMTTTHNTAYATMSISFVPEDFSEWARLAVRTKSFPGQHTQVEWKTSSARYVSSTYIFCRHVYCCRTTVCS